VWIGRWKRKRKRKRMRGVRRRVLIGDGGFVGFFMVVCGGFRWIPVVVGFRGNY
jgi:hypothetical protein